MKALGMAMVVLLTAASAGAHPPTDDHVAGVVHARLDSLTRAGVFSGAVLISHGDHVVLREAFGLASVKDQRPNQPDTRFNVGSINKEFTSVAIHQLAAAGKLALTDTISRYLPDYPAEKGKRITIQQLLDHRGGTGRMFGDRFVAAKDGLRSIDDYMKVVRDEPLIAEPGTRQEYSNTGYVLLGAIIEKVSGESYYDYVRKHVFQPTGMKSTDSYARDANVSNRAIGYTDPAPPGAPPDAGSPGAPPSPLRDNSDFLPMRGSSAGGGYSTVDDLKRFADALRAGKLGMPPVKGGMEFAGGAPGVNAVVDIEEDWTFIVLANRDPRTAELQAAWLREHLAPPRAGGGQEVRVSARDAGGPHPHAAPENTSIPSAPVTVPMARAGHMPMVDVMVNGQGPFHFAIDTGAAGSLRIDSALVAKLGLPVVGEVRGGDPSGKNLRVMQMVRVDSIAIGGARFSGMMAAVRDYNEPGRDRFAVDGILGFGLFADCLVTLDYPGNQLRIETGSLPAANGRDVLAFQDDRGIPSVPLDVAGHAVTAHLDAGSMGGFMMPDSMMSQLQLASEPKVVGRARTVSNSFEIKAADLDGTISLGGLRFDKPTVTFQPVMPGVNVGSRVLSDLRLTFDQKSKLVRIERPGLAGLPK